MNGPINERITAIRARWENRHRKHVTLAEWDAAVREYGLHVDSDLKFLLDETERLGEHLSEAVARGEQARAKHLKNLRLEKALEKCKEQRDARIICITSDEDHDLEVGTLNAELEKILSGREG